jgi:hypothetical protein
MARNFTIGARIGEGLDSFHPNRRVQKSKDVASSVQSHRGIVRSWASAPVSGCEIAIEGLTMPDLDQINR